MKKYIFPVLLALVLLASFIIIHEVKNQHSSQVKNYDKQLSDLKKSNAHYENQNKNFQIITDSLKTKYLQSKSLLEKQITQNRKLGNEIKNLVYSPFISEVSNTEINQSDSLKDLAIQLDLSSSVSDSLCKIQIERLEKINQLQAKQIAFCDSNYRFVQQSLESSIEKNKENELQNQDLKRQVKRNKLIAKIEGTVLLLTATVISTLLFIH